MRGKPSCTKAPVRKLRLLGCFRCGNVAVMAAMKTSEYQRKPYVTTYRELLLASDMVPRGVADPIPSQSQYRDTKLMQFARASVERIYFVCSVFLLGPFPLAARAPMRRQTRHYKSAPTHIFISRRCVLSVDCLA